MAFFRRAFFVVAVVFVVSLPGARAQQFTPAFAAALQQIDAKIAADFARDGIGGMSIGVVSGSGLIWSKHYGYAEAETKRVATNDTDYRIGSITKQFTVLALLQLVDQGKMRTSDPIEKYVPEIKAVQGAPPGAPPITILQVGTMMSGLAREPECPNHSVGPVSIWQQKVLGCLPKTKYQFEPGRQYLYSNIGYATLGLAIERAGGQPYITQVTDRIFKPLGMARSAFDATPMVRSNLAHGYVRPNGGGAPSRAGADAELDGRGYRVPNGAIFSTINDMAKFVAFELGNGPETVLKKDPQNFNYAVVYSAPTAGNGAMASGYGLGFQVVRRGEVVMLGHGGSTEGYHAAALFHRSSKLGVIVLRNCDSCVVDAQPVAVEVLTLLANAAK
jgi:CubicO group peptidase (beta-lactamase class C family)